VTDVGATEAPGLISVRTDVVLDVLIGSMAAAVAERMAEGLPPAAEAALPRAATVPEPPASEDVATAVARAGWHAREVELARFERAEEPSLVVTSMLSDVEACATLAAGEPLERPQPGDERAVTWQVPGPGGHVRHYLAERAVAELGGAQAAAGLKRCWVFGFLLACAPPGVVR